MGLPLDSTDVDQEEVYGDSLKWLLEPRGQPAYQSSAQEKHLDSEGQARKTLTALETPDRWILPL